MRILAYIFRWYANLRLPKTQWSLSALTANELMRSHDALIRIVQTQSYTTELASRATVPGGPMLVQAHLSQHYWIVHGRNTIRRILRQYPRCNRFKALTQEQPIRSLSAARSTLPRPFTHTVLD